MRNNTIELYILEKLYHNLIFNHSFDHVIRQVCNLGQSCVSEDVDFGFQLGPGEIWLHPVQLPVPRDLWKVLQGKFQVFFYIEFKSKSCLLVEVVLVLSEGVHIKLDCFRKYWPLISSSIISHWGKWPPIGNRLSHIQVSHMYGKLWSCSKTSQKQVTLSNQ